MPCVQNDVEGGPSPSALHLNSQWFCALVCAGGGLGLVPYRSYTGSILHIRESYKDRRCIYTSPHAEMVMRSVGLSPTLFEVESLSSRERPAMTFPKGTA